MPELKTVDSEKLTPNKPLPPGSVIGIFGGGQLGRMSAIAAARLGYDTHIFCPKEDSPAFHVSRYSTRADYTDKTALKEFSQSTDVITFEFENIPHDTIKEIQKYVPVRPNWRALHLSQNRIREKNHIKKLGFQTVDFYIVRTFDDLKTGVKQLGTPCILKTTELGYDGKGQFLINNTNELTQIWQFFNGKEGILEAFITFESEVSAIVARGLNGTLSAFDVGKNSHKNGLLQTTIVPANCSQQITDKALSITKQIAESLDIIGLLAVEFFVTKTGDLLFNEMAPRPHNSGHWTLDGCHTCQFEQFIRAVCGLPFGSTKRHSKVKMHNLIGDDINSIDQWFNSPDSKIHLYGKESIAKGRKMGHINIIS